MAGQGSTILQAVAGLHAMQAGAGVWRQASYLLEQPNELCFPPGLLVSQPRHGCQAVPAQLHLNVQMVSLQRKRKSSTAALE